MGQYSEQILTDLHNLDMDEREVALSDFKEDLQSFDEEQLTLLADNLQRIKSLVLATRRARRQVSARQVT